MYAVLETSDRHVDSVLVLIDSFWTAFIYRTFSSEMFYRLRSCDRQMNLRRNVPRSVCWRGMVDTRLAYSYSSYFSDQVSCIKYFNLTYSLKDINFQSFNHF